MHVVTVGARRDGEVHFGHVSQALGLSGPIAMVVAGLLIENPGSEYAMSANTRRHVDLFSEMVDELLNAVLFVLIGPEALLVSLKPIWLLARAGAILLALFARLASISLPVRIIGCLRVRRRYDSASDPGRIARRHCGRAGAFHSIRRQGCPALTMTYVLACP